MTKTVITKPDSHGRKLRDARKVLTMHEARGVSIATATLTVATAGGWQENHPRIEEVRTIAEQVKAAR